MSRKHSSVAEELVLGPWWASALLAIGASVVVTGVFGTGNTSPVLAAWRPFGWLMVFCLALLSAISALRGWANRRVLDAQTGIDSLINLSWKEFEELMAEAFRRQGYAVEEMLGAGADGGIDLTLRRGSEKILVQCKRWRNKLVPVSVVREMYGLLMADSASASAKIVTTSEFTSDAKQFAEDKPMELIGKDTLLKLLRDVQGQKGGSARIVLAARAANSPTCPRCDSEMVRRTAKKGPSAGQDFWGCMNYPECRVTRDGKA